MNRVKTDSWAALSEHTLNNLVRIRMEGPPLEEFDSTPAIQLWASSANRRPKEQGSSTIQEILQKRPKVLIKQDDSSPEESYDTDDNEENELIKELEDLE